MLEPHWPRPCAVSASWRALSILLLLLSAAGCGTRTIRQQVYEEDAVTVVLRHRIEGGRIVRRGFDHPASASEERLMHVLGALEIETPEGSSKLRSAAIHPRLLRPMARGLAIGLEQASSDQEIALMALRRERQLGVFHEEFLTSLVASLEGDWLSIHLSRVEWEVPKRTDEEGGPEALPEPRTHERQMPFRSVAGPMMRPAGSQGVSVRWLDALFDRPVVGAGADDSRVRRRTILMESPIPREEHPREAAGGADELDGDTLRALADLEDARREGRLTETQYQERRSALLDGASAPSGSSDSGTKRSGTAR